MNSACREVGAKGQQGGISESPFDVGREPWHGLT